MKARDYIEHNYIPWILNLDTKDTINHFLNGKEAYLCELYNHINSEFKTIERYELYMFRINYTKYAFPIGLCNVITVKTPPSLAQGDAAYIIIVYNDKNLIYYTVDLVIERIYQITKYQNHSKKTIGNVNLELADIYNLITNEMLGL